MFSLNEYNPTKHDTNKIQNDPQLQKKKKIHSQHFLYDQT